MEKLFQLKENGTTVRTEILAGLTTFMTMAYILAVNPFLPDASNCKKSPGLVHLGSGTVTKCFFFMAPIRLAGRGKT